MRNATTILLLAAIAVSFANDVSAFGVGRLGSRFSNEGSIGSTKKVVIPSCPSPTAPNGVVDLSVCSNAFYVAVILF